MTKIAKVQLVWVDDKLSELMPQRKCKLARPVRFDHQGPGWKDKAWTLVFELEANPGHSKIQIGTARFLAEDAPESWLVEGRCFDVFEGARPLAKGSIKQVTSKTIGVVNPGSLPPSR